MTHFLTPKPFSVGVVLILPFLAVLAVSHPRNAGPSQHAAPVCDTDEGQSKESTSVPPASRPPVDQPTANRKLILQKGDKIAWVGNSLAERMNLYGHFETMLHSRFPDLELVVRNFGWPGDMVDDQRRPANYTTIDDPFKVFDPDLLFCFFGFNESFAGIGGLASFKAHLEAYLANHSHKRLVLVSPIAFENLHQPSLPDGRLRNESLRAYALAMREVALQQNVVFVDLFNPTAELFSSNPADPFTLDGAHLNEHGDLAVAQILDQALFDSPLPSPAYTTEFQQLRQAVNDKSFLHQNDYRMLNGWYVYGGRRKPYDVNTFPEEYAKLRRMVAERDRQIWSIARGDPVPYRPRDEQTGLLTPVKTAFGTKAYSEPETLRYLSPDDALNAFTLAPGYQINLFASEIRFPELANPNQINFDNQGRLWSLALPTYPQWQPGQPRPNDKLLIFVDSDHDGAADRVKVFADRLHAPLGFEFGNGGVYVSQPPRLLFLKDTDGDDKADLREVLLDGFGAEDTHVGICAIEWNPTGDLLLLEGVAKSTTVETIYGPVRRHQPTLYRFNPRTLALKVFMNSQDPNPWGYVHDRWGQGFLCDGTTAGQFWTTPMSGSSGRRRGVDPFLQYKGVALRPAVGCEFVSSRHFPPEAQGNYLWACVINLNGIPWFRLREQDSGYTGQPLPHLVVSSDRNFRPVDPQFGPDGALYFGDWHNPLVGHMQYSQRDPNRDHSHGRIYRVTAANRPLIPPVTQHGKSIPELLDQLKQYEDRTRYRARRELRDRDSSEVISSVKSWVARLDPGDPEYEHHLTEALWVQCSHQLLDPPLLKRLLRASQHQARAAALLVVADWADQLSNPIDLIRPLVADPHPQVRLTAIRAIGFFPPSLELTELALKVVTHPMDPLLHYSLRNTLESLANAWKEPLAAKAVALDNPQGLDFLKDFYLNHQPASPAEKHLRRLLTGDDQPEARQKNISSLAVLNGKPAGGQAVFNRLCALCHQINNHGVQFGPDLSLAGDRLNKAEIIESILFPQAKVDPAFQAVNVETSDGEAVTGIMVSQDDQQIIVRIAGGELAPMPFARIQSIETNGVSSMPDGLAAGLAASEFLDLVEYIASCRTPRPAASSK